MSSRILASLVLAVALSGCVSTTEHRAFVQAARRYYDSVGADGAVHNERCLGLGELSRRTRAATHADFGRAIEEAEKR